MRNNTISNFFRMLIPGLLVAALFHGCPGGGGSSSASVSFIDFNQGSYDEQLVSGWYAYENPSAGHAFRWIGQKAVAKLKLDPALKHLNVSGYIADIASYEGKSFNITVLMNNNIVKVEAMTSSGTFKMNANVPANIQGEQVEVTLALDKFFIPSNVGKGDDKRQLGCVINALGLVN